MNYFLDKLCTFPQKKEIAKKSDSEKNCDNMTEETASSVVDETSKYGKKEGFHLCDDDGQLYIMGLKKRNQIRARPFINLAKQSNKKSKIVNKDPKAGDKRNKEIVNEADSSLNVTPKQKKKKQKPDQDEQNDNKIMSELK
ncbi:hypothetical protein DPMN_009765 [Dreissena polymorpha]|uniref:Uncharacterized protein n=1 Tax=Dreissena polymorpha TaxID=45954 RepID=A0A9D4S0W3_DREPO|nr:hypothetical protein DPMN_009765 [Dreissena polymorpha]